jgi:hypothetical protein
VIVYMSSSLSSIVYWIMVFLNAWAYDWSRAGNPNPHGNQTTRQKPGHWHAELINRMALEVELIVGGIGIGTLLLTEGTGSLRRRWTFAGAGNE